MNSCDYDRLAAREMLLRFGVKRYRKPRKCDYCGCKAMLYNIKTKACYECCIRLEKRKGLR